MFVWKSFDCSIKKNLDGGVVFHDVINMRHAKNAAKAGVDGLILVVSDQ